MKDDSFDKNDKQQANQQDVQQANEATEKLQDGAQQIGAGGPASSAPPPRGVALKLLIEAWDFLWSSLPVTVVNGKEKLDTPKFTEAHWQTAEQMAQKLPTQRAQVGGSAEEVKKQLAMAATNLDQFS